jgi:cardiolipin synthase A/B
MTKRSVAAAVAVLTSAGCSPALPTGIHGIGQPIAVIATVTDGPYTLLQEPQAGYSVFTKLIDGAQKSVRMTMYALTATDVVQALSNAHQRGADVRVILDAAFRGRKTNQSAYDQLSAAGVGVVWAPSSRIVHQKSMVIDDSAAVVSTANLEPKFYPTSRDAVIEVSMPEEVSAIASTFDADYASAGAGLPSQAIPAPHLIWSPAARSVFIKVIESAKSTVWASSEELKDRPIVIALRNAAARGVDCRIVLNADARDTSPVRELTQAGCQVHLMPTTSKGLYMHEQIMLADQDSLIVGSQNLSTMSLLENRELALQIGKADAPKLVAAVQAQFESDFANAVPA